MIRNKYTNKQLTKIPKYQKFLMLRSFNLLFIIFIYVMMTFKANLIVSSGEILGLSYLLGCSVVAYVLIILHNKSFYGLVTPLKIYQEQMLKSLSNKKSRHGLYSLLITLFYTVLMYFIVTKDLRIVGGFALLTLFIQFALVDVNDLAKINYMAKKLDLEIDEYRILDNDYFDNLTKEQIFYVYTVREEIVVYLYLNKNIQAEALKAKLDEEEYLFVTMLAKQMEKYGR
ncbi:hypothetical protein RZE82_08915 [Mollicutes bacterium LVI A0039]|nr:hypothetical protein RZE82_08915 [Mollicutes bacterium LVI A0039]